MDNQLDSPKAVISPYERMRRVQQAINDHNLEALTDCFEADYHSEFPAHPDRTFVGHTQMRHNWSQLFGAIHDIHAEMIHCVVDGNTAWTEWEWQGTRPDGSVFLQRGVTIQGVSSGRIQWVRLYIEPVEIAGAGSDVAVRQSTTGN